MKLNLRKKTLSILTAGILFAVLLSSHQVNAASPVTSPNRIDGSYATGSTGFFDSANSKYATAMTNHTFNTYKEATAEGYYYSNGKVHLGPSATDATYSDISISAIAYYPSWQTPCGSKGTHTVIGVSGSWTGYSSTGTIRNSSADVD